MWWHCGTLLVTQFLSSYSCLLSSSHAYVRNQRQADKSAPFLERIERIKGCAGDAVEDLILEILESPLRKRNALIDMLRLREKEREKQNEVTRSSNNNGGNRFSNFPQAAVANNAVSQVQISHCYP